MKRKKELLTYKYLLTSWNFYMHMDFNIFSVLFLFHFLLHSFDLGPSYCFTGTPLLPFFVITSRPPLLPLALFLLPVSLLQQYFIFLDLLLLLLTRYNGGLINEGLCTALIAATEWHHVTQSSPLVAEGEGRMPPDSSIITQTRTHTHDSLIIYCN